MNKNSEIFFYSVLISMLMIVVNMLVQNLVFYISGVFEIDTIGYLVSMTVLSILYFVVRLITKDDWSLWKLGIGAIYYMVLYTAVHICMNLFALPSIGPHLLSVCSSISSIIVLSVFIYCLLKKILKDPMKSIENDKNPFITMFKFLMAAGSGSFIVFLMDRETRSNIVNKLSTFSVIYFIFFALSMVDQQCCNGEYYNMLIPTSLTTKLSQTSLLTHAIYVWPKVIFCILDKLLLISLIHNVARVSSRLSELIQGQIAFRKYRKDNPEEFE